jgi:hypothetical protein
MPIVNSWNNIDPQSVRIEYRPDEDLLRADGKRQGVLRVLFSKTSTDGTVKPVCRCYTVGQEFTTPLTLKQVFSRVKAIVPAAVLKSIKNDVLNSETGEEIE